MMSALQPNENELREEPRASLYLAASLYCDGQSVSVKIRNLSPNGALLEVSAPVPASHFTLVEDPTLDFHSGFCIDR